MANGDSLPDPDTLDGVHEVTTTRPGQGSGRAPDKRNHLTLVEFRHTLQLSKIPSPIWEPIAYLYAEWMNSRFLYTMSDPRWCRLIEEEQPHLAHLCMDPEEENLMESRDWVTTLLISGQSVGGWKGDLMTTAIRSDKENPERGPGGKISTDQNGVTKPRGGLRERLFS